MDDTTTHKDPFFWLESAWSTSSVYKGKLQESQVNRLLNDQRDRAAYIFRKLDRTGDGSLSRWEFTRGLQALHIPLKGQALLKFVDIFDQDGDGSIDYTEFAAYVRSCGGAKAEPPPLPFSYKIPHTVMMQDGRPSRWYFWSEKNQIIKVKHSKNLTWKHLIEEFDKEAQQQKQVTPEDKATGWQSYAALRWAQANGDVKCDILSRDEVIDMIKAPSEEKKNILSLQSYVATDPMSSPGRHTFYRAVFQLKQTPKCLVYECFERQHVDSATDGFVRVHVEQRCRQTTINAKLIKVLNHCLNFIQRENDWTVHRLAVDFILDRPAREDHAMMYVMQIAGCTAADGAPAHVSSSGGGNSEPTFVENMMILTMPRGSENVGVYAKPPWCRGDFCIFLPSVLMKESANVFQHMAMSPAEEQYTVRTQRAQLPWQLISSGRTHPAILNACDNSPETQVMFSHNDFPNRRIDNGKVQTFQLKLSNIKATVQPPGVYVFIQLRGPSSREIQITVTSPKGASIAADPESLHGPSGLRMDVQDEILVPIGENEPLSGIWLLTISDSGVVDKGTRVEFWGIKAYVTKEPDRVIRHQQLSDSLTAPTMTQLGQMGTSQRDIARKQVEVCKRCYKVYLKLQSVFDHFETLEWKQQHIKPVVEKSILDPPTPPRSPKSTKKKEDAWVPGSLEAGTTSKKFLKQVAQEVTKRRFQPSPAMVAVKAMAALGLSKKPGKKNAFISTKHSKSSKGDDRADGSRHLSESRRANRKKTEEWVESGPGGAGISRRSHSAPPGDIGHLPVLDGRGNAVAYTSQDGATGEDHAANGGYMTIDEMESSLRFDPSRLSQVDKDTNQDPAPGGENGEGRKHASPDPDPVRGRMSGNRSSVLEGQRLARMMAEQATGQRLQAGQLLSEVLAADAGGQGPYATHLDHLRSDVKSAQGRVEKLQPPLDSIGDALERRLFGQQTVAYSPPSQSKFHDKHVPLEGVAVTTDDSHRQESTSSFVLHSSTSVSDTKAEPNLSSSPGSEPPLLSEHAHYTETGNSSSSVVPRNATVPEQGSPRLSSSASANMPPKSPGEAAKIQSAMEDAEAREVQSFSSPTAQPSDARNSAKSPDSITPTAAAHHAQSLLPIEELTTEKIQKEFGQKLSRQQVVREQKKRFQEVVRLGRIARELDAVKGLSRVQSNFLPTDGTRSPSPTKQGLGQASASPARASSSTPSEEKYNKRHIKGLEMASSLHNLLVDSDTQLSSMKSSMHNIFTEMKAMPTGIKGAVKNSGSNKPRRKRWGRKTPSNGPSPMQSPQAQAARSPVLRNTMPQASMHSPTEGYASILDSSQL